MNLLATRIGMALALLIAGAQYGLAHTVSAHTERLPVMGPAPDFALTSQDNRPVALADLRGRVVALTFIYTSCTDTCPVLTALMVKVQQDLGAAFGSKVAFVSITVDPERDTPEALKKYAEDFGADLRGWSFLTGSPKAISDVEHRYGVVAKKADDGDIDHTLLTSLIDTSGTMRVQYLGYSFDPREFRSDLISLEDK